MGCATIRKNKDPLLTMNSPLKSYIPKGIARPKSVFTRINFRNSLVTIHEVGSCQEVSCHEVSCNLE